MNTQVNEAEPPVSAPASAPAAVRWHQHPREPTEVYTTSGLPLKRLSLEIAIPAMANDLHQIPDPDSPHICVSYPMKLRVIKYLCLRIFRTGNALTHSNSSKYIPS